MSDNYLTVTLKNPDDQTIQALSASTALEALEWSNAKPNQNMVYAFWSYDLPPYVLGGEGTLLEDGSIKLQGYGGMVIRRNRGLIAIYPVAAGSRIMEQITACSKAYTAKVHQADDELKNAVIEALPESKRFL